MDQIFEITEQPQGYFLEPSNSFAGYVIKFMVSNLRIDFAQLKSQDGSMIFSKSSAVKSMHDNVDYITVDMISQFIAAFANRVTGY